MLEEYLNSDKYIVSSIECEEKDDSIQVNVEVRKVVEYIQCEFTITPDGIIFS